MSDRDDSAKEEDPRYISGASARWQGLDRDADQAQSAPSNTLYELIRRRDNIIRQLLEVQAAIDAVKRINL